MGAKPPTRKELAHMMIETYLQINGLLEFMRQFAMAEMFKNYEKDFTARQRQIWREFEMEKPIGQRKYVKKERG